MKNIKQTYTCPTLDVIVMDNEISLALASNPWEEPVMNGALDLGPEPMMEETIVPLL